MYTMQATIPFSQTHLGNNETPYLSTIERTIKMLGSYHGNFLTLGIVDDNIQEKIDEIIESAEPRDEGLTEGEIEQLEEMAKDGHLTFLTDPQRCIRILLEIYEKLERDHPTGHRSYLFHGQGGNGRGDMSLSMPPNHGKVGLSIGFPHLHENDFWFNDVNKMRSLVSDVVGIWQPEWLAVRPWAYFWNNIYEDRNPLFRERKTFGWMGYTSQKFNEQTDALALIEPMNEGTFLLLKPDMMTLWPEDIEKAHRAEAFLADYDILPLSGL